MPGMRLALPHNRSFIAIWLGQLISSLGDYFYYLAMPLTIYKLTGSTVAMSAAMIALALPGLLVGPFAGVMVDRWDRRLTMIVSNLGRAIVVLLCLFVQSADQIWIFYVVGVLQSSCGQFFFPARNAAVPLIVRKDELASANGLLQMTMVFAMIAGAGTAGVAIQFLGISFAFIANSIGYLLASVAVTFATVPHTIGHARPALSESTTHPVRAVLAEMYDGLVYLVGSRTLVGILVCNVVLMLGLGALNVVWVPFMQKTFGIGPAGLGAVDTAQGIGMAVGSLAIGWLSLRFRQVTLVGVGLAWAGSMLVLIGLSPVFGVVLIWAGLAGLGIPLINAGLTTITQLVVPDAKMGRIGGLVGSLTNVASVLSMALAGLAGELIDLRLIYVIAGAFIITAGLVSLRVIPEPTRSVREAIAA